MRSPETPTSPEVDRTSCDREPIQTPGSIQPHGLLMTLGGPGWTVRQVSRNTVEVLGLGLDAVLGRSLADVLGGAALDRLGPGLVRPDLDDCPRLIGTVRVHPDAGERAYHAVAHRRGGVLILELEPTGGAAESAHEFYPPLQAFLARLDAVASVDDLAALAAAEVRRITGFDRVLVYRFDDDFNGTVIAEDRNDRLPSYLGQRFPASDVPKQARDLYRLNRLRLIPDAGCTPVPIVPGHDRPLDLSFAALRGVSTVDVESMRGMGASASMSVSVVRGGGLWGLICCHHAEPRLAPFGVRAACDFLGQVFSLQAANKEHQAEFEHRLSLVASQTRLIASLTAHDRFVPGLVNLGGELLAFAGATGGAILFDGQCTRLGDAPEEDEILRLADWLAADVRQEVFSTDSLAREIPWAEAIKDRAAGLLAVSISKLHRNYLLWFRPEVVRTVTWAGDPARAADPPADGGPVRLQPGHSSRAWTEVVRLRSDPWRPSEVDAAAGLRNAIVGVVLRKAEELAGVNAELERSNQELEAFSYSVSHDLRAPFRHIVGYAELLRETEGPRLGPGSRRFLETIIESAQYAGKLVDNLLAFSRMGRTHVHPVEVDMNAVVREAVDGLARETAGRTVVWKLGDLPPAWGDLMMIRQAVVNLLQNAVKYTRPRAEAVIEVAGAETPEETVYSVRDNGIGFDMRYADKLFGVFQRLHRMEDFEGTGIGLANVRRIAARHGGRAWAEGAVDVGAAFFFSLPRPGAAGQGVYAETDTPGGR